MDNRYERHYVSSETRMAKSVGGKLACYTRTNVLPAPATLKRSFVSSEHRTLVKGDRVHALPFTGSYREAVPMSGRLQCTSFYDTDRPPHDFTTCGSTTGTTEKWVADIGYYISNPSVLEPPPKDLLLMQRLKAQADTKALANLRSAYVNVPLILADRRETVQLLGRKAKQLTALIGQRQRADLVRYFQTRKADRRLVARDIANEHLSFLFGVLPLVSEAEGLCDLLSQDNDIILTGRGRATELGTVHKDRSSIPKGTQVAHRYVPAYLAMQERMTRYSHRTSLRTRITAASAARLRDWGFNPIATAYDLVPLSFLTDFVSNLGTFLRTYDPLIGVTFETGSSTSWRELKETLTVDGTSAHHTDVNGRKRLVQCSGSGMGFTRALEVHREVLTDYPEASLMFVNNMSYGKAATLVSLAVMRYLKPVRSLISRKPFRYRGKRPTNLPNINYS